MSNENYHSYYTDFNNSIGETDYLQKRGISSKTVDLYSIGYDKNYKAIVFPIDDESYETRRIEASSQGRYFKKGAAKIFNKAALEGDEPVFITEGIIDALSIIEVGGNAISLCSANNVGLLTKEVKEKSNLPPLIIALDNDDVGREAAKKLLDELEQLNTVSKIVNLYGNCKDANEALVHSRAVFTSAVVNAVSAAKESPTNYKHCLNPQYFLDYIVKAHGANKYETPFSELNAALGGGLYEELYTIGAVSSLGKSTFLIQLLDGLAASGRSVIYYSLEAGKINIMSKSISRITLKNSLAQAGNKSMALNSLDVMNVSCYSPQSLDCFKKSINEYASFSSRIQVYQREDGCKVEDIAAVVERFILDTGEHPVVAIDYLQILDASKKVILLRKQPMIPSQSLKAYGTVLVPVIVISSLNRQSYDKPVSLASFKESGSIEYTSDVVIGLQYKGVEKNDFNFKEALKNYPRHIELCVLKNRNGPSDAIIEFEFYPPYSHFKEGS